MPAAPLSALATAVGTLPSRHGVVTVVGAVLLWVSLLGCGAGSDAVWRTGEFGTARPLTSEEAETLAITRFINHDIGLVRIDATIPDGTDAWRLYGWFDYGNGRGYAAIWADGAPNAAALLLWSPHYLLSRDANGVAAEELPPLPAPDIPSGPASAESAWSRTTYAPSEHVPHAALQIIANLGADRPENPLLLRQSDAMWLRSAELDGRTLDIFAGPRSATTDTREVEPANPGAATVRYWLDVDGRMRRVEMRLGATWGTVDLLDIGAESVTIPDPLPHSPDDNNAAAYEGNITLD